VKKKVIGLHGEPKRVSREAESREFKRGLYTKKAPPSKRKRDWENGI